MDVKEIAKALTEAVLARDFNRVIGPGVSAGRAEEIGKKVGELYKGILTGVIDAIESTKGEGSKPSDLPKVSS